MQKINEQMKAKIDAITRALPAILKEQGQKIPLDISTLINSNMNAGAKTRDPNNIRISKSQKLNNFRSLSRSFVQGQPGSLTEIRTDVSGAVINVGSDLPYASVHEYGGFIKSKGNMHKYFWYMYYKNKGKSLNTIKSAVIFKNLALHVQAVGGVTIPKRPYFNNSLKEFEQKRFLGILQEIINQLIKLF